MEEDRAETASTLGVEALVLDDDAGAADNSTKPTLEEGANSCAGASDEVQKVKVVVATEEQFQSVFSNSLVSSKFNLPNICPNICPEHVELSRLNLFAVLCR